MAEQGPLFLRNQREQSLFDFFRRGFTGQTQALCQARHMGVDDDAAVDIERVSQDHVGRLAADAAKLRQIVHGPRHFALILFDDGLTCRFYAFGFVAEKPGTLDLRLQLGQRGVGKRLGIGILFEQARGDQVDPLIGALSRQDGSDEQFKGIAVVQFAMRLRIGSHQTRHDLSRAAGFQFP